MSESASQLDTYIDTYIDVYNRYQLKYAVIEKIHNEATEIEQTLQNTMSLITSEEKKQAKAIDAYERAKKKLDEYLPIYNQKIVSRSIDADLNAFKVLFDAPGSTGVPEEYLTAKQEYEQAKSAVKKNKKALDLASRKYDECEKSFRSAEAQQNQDIAEKISLYEASLEKTRFPVTEDQHLEFTNLTDKDVYNAVCDQVKEIIQHEQDLEIEASKEKNEKEKSTIQEKISRTFDEGYCMEQVRNDSNFHEIFQKKDELDAYFSSLKKHKKKYGFIMPEVLSAMQLDEEYCNCSAEDLSDKIRKITDVTLLPTKTGGKMAHDAARKSKAVRTILVLFDITILGLLMYFFHGFLHISYMPFSTAIFWVVRIFIMLIATPIVTVLAYRISLYIFEEFTMSIHEENWAFFFAIVFFLLTLKVSYNVTGNILSAETFSEAGNTISSGISLILEIAIFLLLTLTVSAIFRQLLVCTPISRLFCSKSAIAVGYETVIADYKKYTMAYICLYHLPEAAKCVLNYCYNEEMSTLARKSADEIQQITQRNQKKQEDKLSELNSSRAKQEKEFNDKASGLKSDAASKLSTQKKILDNLLTSKKQCQKKLAQSKDIVLQKRKQMEDYKRNAIEKKRTELKNAENARIKKAEEKKRRLDTECNKCQDKLDSSKKELAGLNEKKLMLEKAYRNITTRESKLKSQVAADKTSLEDLIRKMVQSREQLSDSFAENATLLEDI